MHSPGLLQYPFEVLHPAAHSAKKSNDYQNSSNKCNRPSREEIGEMTYKILMYPLLPNRGQDV